MPYISNLYSGKQKLKSLTENDTYFLRGDMMGLMASLYDGVDSKNPLAWPYYADNKYWKAFLHQLLLMN